MNAKKYLKCVCMCVSMSIPWEESIMNNRTEAAQESVNTELFVCLRVVLCVYAQAKWQHILEVDVLFQFVCVCVSE